MLLQTSLTRVLVSPSQDMKRSEISQQRVAKVGVSATFWDVLRAILATRDPTVTSVVHQNENHLLRFFETPL